VHPLFPLCIINVGLERQTYLSLPACDMSCVNSTVPEETLPSGTIITHRNKLGTVTLPNVCYFHIKNIRKHKRKFYEHFFVTLLQGEGTTIFSVIITFETKKNLSSLLYKISDGESIHGKVSVRS